MSYAAAALTGAPIAGRFVAEDVVGRGRSATVYRALDLQTQTHVALKVLDPLLARDPVTLERFRREVAIVRALDHPDIIRVFDVLYEHDTCIICTEYIEGVDGKRYLKRFGRLTIADFMTCARRIIAALGACHRQRVLHRDLKPQNILFGKDLAIKLVDFGVSHLASLSDFTRTGTVLGTAEYMAPELFAGARADPRTDIYALGAVLYELLTERPPHFVGSLPELMQRQTTTPPPPMAQVRNDVPAWLEAIVLKCLQTDAAARYQSCEEVVQDLDRGTNAVAVRQGTDDSIACIHCRAQRIPALPFCAQCGRFGVDSFTHGPYALVLTQCDDRASLAESVARLCGLSSSRGLRRRFASLPLVLFNGLSEETGRALHGELTMVGCDLRLTRQLTRDFRVPRVLYGFTILLMMPLWLYTTTVSGRVFTTSAALAALIALYRWASQPVARLPQLRGGAAPLKPILSELARAISGLNDRQRKSLLGHACAAVLRLQETRSAASAAIDLTSAWRVLLSGAGVAAQLEEYELYLSSRSLNELRERRQVIESKLAHTRDTAVVEPLIAAGTTLDREITDYREIEDRHARGSLALFALNATLQRLQDSAAGPVDVTALQTLEEELQRLPGAAA